MRILIVKLSSLGDIAHALPAVRLLKARTGAAIDWVVQPEYAPLLDACTLVDRTIHFPRKHFFRDFLPFRRALRENQYDLVLDLQGLMKSAIAARLSRAAWRVGPAWSREGSHLLYDARPDRRDGPRRHATDELIDLIDTVAPPPEDGAPEPPLPPLDFTFPESAAPDDPGPRIAFTPFSRWTTKDWPSDHFIALGRRLLAEIGGTIRILGGPADTAAGQAMAAAIGDRATNLCGHTTLPTLCSELQSADLVIGVDSGPLHWANLLGTPLVAIYGSTDPARTGPWNNLFSVLTVSLPCRPCHSRTCATAPASPVPPCLSSLSPDTVLAAALARL